MNAAQQANEESQRNGIARKQKDLLQTIIAQKQKQQHMLDTIIQGQRGAESTNTPATDVDKRVENIEMQLIAIHTSIKHNNNVFEEQSQFLLKLEDNIRKLQADAPRADNEIIQNLKLLRAEYEKESIALHQKYDNLQHGERAHIDTKLAEVETAATASIRDLESKALQYGVSLRQEFTAVADAQSVQIDKLQAQLDEHRQELQGY